MEIKKSAIKGGVYLVIDPSSELITLKTKLLAALESGVAVIQIWNHWQAGQNKKQTIEEVGKLASPFGVPVLINEDWKLMQHCPVLDGLHFDQVPANMDEISASFKKPFFCGITCSNNLSTVMWAVENKLDYVSFCSMFPSSSAGSCEIVMPENVVRTKEITDIPVFVAGGLTPENVAALKENIPFDGIAVISGVMSSDKPGEKVTAYLNALKK